MQTQTVAKNVTISHYVTTRNIIQTCTMDLFSSSLIAHFVNLAALSPHKAEKYRKTLTNQEWHQVKWGLNMTYSDKQCDCRVQVKEWSSESGEGWWSSKGEGETRMGRWVVGGRWLLNSSWELFPSLPSQRPGQDVLSVVFDTFFNTHLGLLCGSSWGFLFSLFRVF